jgi:hypothetical protein
MMALLLCIALQDALADEMRTVKLDFNNHNKECVSLSYGNIFVELAPSDKEGSASVIIRFENTSEDKILYLFDRSYSEKTLKKMGIYYDKVFQGKKGKRTTESCPTLRESCKLLPSSETKTLFTVTTTGENQVECKLPIYIARFNEKNLIVTKKNRISLAQKDVILLNIEVPFMSGKYMQLSRDINNMRAEIDRQTFCTNKNHQGTSCETLIRLYTESIKQFKGQIDEAIRDKGYTPEQEGYIRFKDLSERLDEFDLNGRIVKKCSNDVITSSHKCKYCSISLEEIYKKLESYYIDLHNGKVTQKQIMNEVETLNSCASKNKKRPDNSSLKKRINDYYKKIKSKE